MRKMISPALKGLITATIMIGVTFGLYYAQTPANSPLQYLPYLLYGLGIVWAIVDYRKSDAFTGKFGDLFSQGFRCFIVVTLVMVAFIAIFLKAQPRFREEGAKAYREYLIKDKNRSKVEIEAEVEKYKDQFNTGFVSASIFGYLIIGALVTAATSAILTRRNQ
jgi:hypothetical protein